MAEEYELDWIFVDGLAATPADLFHAANRVTVSAESPEYRLDEVYVDGKIHWRVRAVGRHAVVTAGEYSHRRPGKWSSIDFVDIAPEDNHERNKNWQYVCNYSRGGLRNCAIAYFDGVLRERQKLSSNTSEDHTLVSEQKFDYEGRSTVTILPAPILDRVFGYQDNFNRDKDGQFLGPEDFFSAGGVTHKLSTDHGAGLYYAAGRPVDWSESNDALVPGAGGYPFSLIEYTRDDFGRVRKIAGIGDKLLPQPTVNIFGNANSTELERLFGSNVGSPLSYRKNITNDANKQATVAYLDQEGRTIATALAGAEPKRKNAAAYGDLSDSSDTGTWRLMRLPENIPESQVVNLNDRNIVDSTARTSVTLALIPNVVSTSYAFRYSFTGVNYETELGESFVCTSCDYRLVIRVKDPNGNTIHEVEHVFSDEAANPCEDDEFVGEQIEFTVNFEDTGTYEVVKILELLTGPVDETIVEAGGPLLIIPFIPYLEARLGEIDPSDCDVTCEDHCRSALGESASDSQVAACAEACRSSAVAAASEEMAESRCENLWELFLIDVGPGGNRFPKTWQEVYSAGHTFLDAEGNPVTGVIDEQWLLENWQNTWADEILEFLESNPELHPEFCHYTVTCLNDNSREILVASDAYDTQLGAVESFASALAQGFLNPLDMPQSQTGLPVSQSARDPYFLGDGGAPPFGSAADMRNRLRNYVEDQSDPGQYLSLWEAIEEFIGTANSPGAYETKMSTSFAGSCSVACISV